ncbi:MAG TPA: cupin domain-containing protein [Egibacteraceae bacterium]|nr:cupin domain-containing protein [Actinomycetota bacterium]HWB71024.1 cupin domain-containing protein [Egibacteraceae bacterium]
MDARFDEIYDEPENEIFKVVFPPDRIYHARYLSAARSERYRYNVHEVRSQPDITVMKGEVFLDGRHLTNFLRLEYRASRLVEATRERGRRVREQINAWMRVDPGGEREAQASLTLHYDNLIDAHYAELWETLEPHPGSSHHHRVLDLMGKDAPIIRVEGFTPALADVRALRQVEVAFAEPPTMHPFGYHIGAESRAWDNNYLRSHQEPRTPDPSADQNTVADGNYLLDFQRGWFLPDASQVAPVRYRNAMMDPGNPETGIDNVIEMRWLFQRELSGSVVFFHEVTIPPGTVEGTHRHIGSEELYYVVSGAGLAYMRDGDDPSTGQYPLVKRQVYGIGERDCREVPVGPGSVLFTKSGGVHGIRNPGTEPLRFVAFLYHST